MNCIFHFQMKKLFPINNVHQKISCLEDKSGRSFENDVFLHI